MRRNRMFSLLLAAVMLLGAASAVAAENSFTDVSEKAYYYEPVLWAAQEGVTQGTSETKFSPDQNCTRAQIVTFLWRANGCPAPKSDAHSFIDVKDSAFYYRAMLWAVEEGVTQGTTATTFSPNDPCTRGQAVALIHRAQGAPEISGGANPFTDVSSANYFYQPVLWAVENGVTYGTSATTFEPFKECSRAQIVTFLYRVYYKEVAPLAALVRPQDAEIDEGETVELTAEVSGGKEPYAYQWQKKEGDSWKSLSGAEEAALSVSEAGAYRCRVTDHAGDSVVAAAAAVTVRVREPLTVVTQPKDAEINEEETAELTVAVSGGTAPYTYQWQKKDGETWKSVSGAEEATLNVSEAGEYRCLISDAEGAAVTCTAASVTVNAPEPLTVVTQPKDAAIDEGDTAELTVEVSGGKEPYVYQWQKQDGETWQALSGAEEATLNVTEAGSYRCVVTDDKDNEAVSEAAAVTVNVIEPLTVITQPKDAAIDEGDTVELTIEVSGGKEPYVYQWQKQDGETWQALSGAEEAALTVTEAGSYRCVVTDAKDNEAVSEAAAVTVNVIEPLTVVTQPKDAEIDEGGAAELTIEVSGGKEPYAYQWQKKNGETWRSVSGAEEATLNVTEAGSYRCVVTDAKDDAEISDAAVVTVKEAAPLTVTAAAVEATLGGDGTAVLSVTAAGGAEPYVYQWQKQDGETWQAVSGAEEAELTAEEAGVYRCVVTDADGETVTGDAITVTAP
ncbi:MAG: immunoglobulin domain-containing protein [Bacillota bacterium]|jgi:uncharacterized protein YigE (DUF2233 family)